MAATINILRKEVETEVPPQALSDLAALVATLFPGVAPADVREIYFVRRGASAHARVKYTQALSPTEARALADAGEVFSVLSIDP